MNGPTYQAREPELDELDALLDLKLEPVNEARQIWARARMIERISTAWIRVFDVHPPKAAAGRVMVVVWTDRTEPDHYAWTNDGLLPDGGRFTLKDGALVWEDDTQ